MEKKVKFAVIGCGRISRNHIDAIIHAPHAELVAVCDIVEERAREAAEKYDAPAYYTDIDRMLECEKPDVCCICTPSGLHAECAVKAAKRGASVLCEKPLDVTEEKMQLMIDTCKENNVKLGGIFQRRLFKGSAAVRDAAQKGLLGKITMGSAKLRYYRDQEYYDSGEWRGTWDLDGGGALMNQGIHGVDLLDWIMGGIYSVTAICDTLHWDIEVEDNAVVMVKFKNGAIGTIEGSTSAFPGLDTIFSISGTEGTITLGNGGIYDWLLKDKSIEKPEIDGDMGGLNCAYSSGNYGHTMQVEDMALAVLEDREPMVSAQEAMRSTKIILAIYESARTGKEIVID